MAFKFSWGRFDENVLATARVELTRALNKGKKPAAIAGDINVKELNLGTQPPDLEILELRDLSADRFEGLFRLRYSGNASVVLTTQVQVNPLTVELREPSYSCADAILAANKPLVVPLELTIRELEMNGIVALVVDKSTGTTLSFKYDPLTKVVVSSTFDKVVSVQRFLQTAIERQLRSVFVEDLPRLIHTLSIKRHDKASADAHGQRAHSRASTPYQSPSSSRRPSVTQELDAPNSAAPRSSRAASAFASQSAETPTSDARAAAASSLQLPSMLPSHRLSRALGILASRQLTLYPHINNSDRVVHRAQLDLSQRQRRRPRTPVRRMLF